MVGIRSLVFQRSNVEGAVHLLQFGAALLDTEIHDIGAGKDENLAGFDIKG